MIVSLTGHRPDKLGKEYDLKGPISESLRFKFIEFLREEKPEKCISGMALGADMLWAQTVLSLNIPLIAAIPFIGQEKIWPETSKQMYNDILNNPLTEKVIVSEGGYANWKMQVRNVWMVDNSTLLIAIWDGTTGGTKNCVDYAIKKERMIYRINPKEL